MIGVVCKPGQREFAGEFFELFKTPWEFATPRRRYPVLLVTDGAQSIEGIDSTLVIVASPERFPLDSTLDTRFESTGNSGFVRWQGRKIPIYQHLASFNLQENARLFLQSGHKCTGWTTSHQGRNYIRLGFDLFNEVAALLQKGQPPEQALSPTLDLHIHLLRSAISQSGIELVEILPVPAGHDFICCLTHDIDFYQIRRHRFDHTMMGFLYRALLGTPLQAAQGRRNWAAALENWKCAAALPLVFMGLARDPWNPFRDYLELEAGLPSTYFVIPFKNQPGMAPSGETNWKRAVRYQAGEIANELNSIHSAGCEVALHGIDAWSDPQAGETEKKELDAARPNPGPAGIRMHWLYWNKKSPAVLEQAGFNYDSTLGYNEAVGYRNGTGQVFLLPGTTQLLELPLHLQDTALFFPDRMNLTEEKAFAIFEDLLQNCRLFGGTLTLNWHDRSLAPERLWGDFYRQVLAKLKQSNPWFATAGQATEWFRTRRQKAIKK